MEDMFRLEERNTESLKAEIMTVKDGIILPHLYGHNDSGGVFDADGKIIQESLYRGEYIKRGGEYGAENISRIIDLRGGGVFIEKVLFLGHFIKHWGHFLVDCIGRFWILCNEEYKNHKVVYLANELREVEGIYLDFFRYLGVDEDRLVSIRTPTRFDEIVIPSTGYDASGNYSPEYTHMIQQVIRASGADSIDTPRKVYLTRTNFIGAKVKETGEKQIEQVFADNGWAVMSPEKLSLREQIAIFQNAEEVACVNGTIPLNVIFARPGLKLTIINKSHIRHRAAIKVCNMAGVEPVYVDAYYEPFRGIPFSWGWGPFWLVINDNMKRYFADKGMKINPSALKTNIACWTWYITSCFMMWLRGTKFGNFLEQCLKRIKYFVEGTKNKRS